MLDGYAFLAHTLPRKGSQVNDKMPALSSSKLQSVIQK